MLNIKRREFRHCAQFENLARNRQEDNTNDNSPAHIRGKTPIN